MYLWVLFLSDFLVSTVLLSAMRKKLTNKGRPLCRRPVSIPGCLQLGLESLPSLEFTSEKPATAAQLSHTLHVSLYNNRGIFTSTCPAPLSLSIDSELNAPDTQMKSLSL